MCIGCNRRGIAPIRGPVEGKAAAAPKPAANTEDGTMGFDWVVIALVILVILVLLAGVKTVPQGYNYTVERFGRFTRTLTPGLSIIVPFIDRIGSQDEHDGAGARRADAGGHHQGQRHGLGRRRRLLPGARRGARRLRGARAGERHPAAHHDQPPHRHGRHGPRRAALQARRHQRPAAARGRFRRRRPGASRSPASRSRRSTRRATSSSRWAGR